MTVLALLLVLSLNGPSATARCDAACERESAEVLIQKHQLQTAIRSLNAASARYPEDPTLPRLLARAHLLEDDLFWSEKTLQTALERRPADAEIFAWLALVHLRQSEPQLALEVLETSPAAPAGPDRTRRALLAARRALLAGEHAEARSLRGAIDGAASAYPEDRAVWSALKAALDRWWFDPISGEFEIESNNGWLLFGGAGHHVYCEDRRTRTEWGLGCGDGQWSP